MATHSGEYLAATLKPNTYASGIVTFAVASLAVLLRFVARRLKKLNWWYDDWFIVAALVSAAGYLIATVTWMQFGLGRHHEAIDMDSQELVYHSLQHLIIVETLWSTTVTFVKISILSFYWRLFNMSSIRLPIRLLGVLTMLWLIARLVAIFMHCVPLRGFWDKTVEAHCGVDDRLFFLGTNTTHLLIDIVLLLMPIPYIRQLYISKAQKIILCGIFLLGGFVCIISIILIVECVRLDPKSPDITWNFAPIILWAGVEQNLAIVSACLPSLRPIYLLAVNRLKTDRTDRTKQSGYGPSASRNRFSGRTANPSKELDSDFTRIISVTAPDSEAGPTDARGEQVGQRTEVVVKVHDAIGLGKVGPGKDGIMVRNEFHVDRSGSGVIDESESKRTSYGK